MINLLMIVAFPLLSFATQDACEMLSQTLKSKEPMIEKAADLKIQCDFEIKNGENAKLIRLLNSFDLSEELTAAHAGRVEGRLKLFVDFKAVLTTLKSNLENLREKTDLKAANIEVISASSLLDNKLKFFLSTQSSPLDETYSKNMNRVLADIKVFTISSNRNDHKTLQVDLNKEIANFKSSSDLQISKLNLLMVSEMRKAIEFISFKKIDIGARVDDLAMKSFANGLSSLIEKIEVVSFWNAYVSKSKLMQRIEGIERRVALGMLQTAIDDYEELKNEIKSVLAKMSVKSKNELMNGAAGFELKRIETRVAKLRSYPTSKAAILLRESMRISVYDIEQNKTVCFAKLPALSPIYAEFKERYNYFANFKMESLSEKNQKLTVKLSEATHVQFDLIRLACAKGKL